MSDDLSARMRRLGFTEKEVDTYFAVLRNGPATAAEIAAAADISRRHVYDVTEKLERRGFVIVNDYFNPTTVEAAPPDEVYETIRAEADEMYEQLNSRYRSRGDRSEGTRVLKSRSTVIKHIIGLINDADSLVGLSLPAGLVPIVEDALRAAVDRDVLVLALVFQSRTGSTTVDDVSLEGAAHVVREREVERTILLTIDDGSALVSSRGVITRPDSPATAISFDRPYFQNVVFKSLINTEWVNATERYAASPAPLPTTYTTFRRAAIDAVLHNEAGRSVEARIEARPTDRPEATVHLEGMVTRVDQRLVEPTTDPPPGLCSMYLETDDGEVTVGGSDADIEEYRAFKTTLLSPE